MFSKAEFHIKITIFVSTALRRIICFPHFSFPKFDFLNHDQSTKSFCIDLALMVKAQIFSKQVHAKRLQKSHIQQPRSLQIISPLPPGFREYRTKTKKVKSSLLRI